MEDLCRIYIRADWRGEKVRQEDFFRIGEYTDNFAKVRKTQSLPIITSSIEKPVISFVIPTCNRPDTLKEAIDSILVQKDTIIQFEVIVVDNSGDHSEQNLTHRLLKQYSDPHISYYQNEINIGLEGNFNRAIELSRGEWVSFLHDDDLISDDYLEKIKKLLEKYDSFSDIGYIKTENLTFTNINELPIKAEVYKKQSAMAKKLWGKMHEIKKIDSLILGYSPTCIPTCGTLMRKKAMMDIGGFNSDYYPSFDAYPGYQMLGKYKVYMTYEPLGYYRWSINVSLKKETMTGSLQANYYFRECLYSQNIFNYLYGKVFGDAYYSKNVDDWRNKAELHKVQIVKQDFEQIHVYKDCKVRKKIIVFIQRVYNKMSKMLSK